MKKTLTIVLLALFSAVCLGQDSGALKFLGIPIDGTEMQFTTKLKKKGFIYSFRTDSYKGQFNGYDVDVIINTNHNQVDRVVVFFPPKDEKGIKTDYNYLLDQFKDNVKYMEVEKNEMIPFDERFSYEFNVNKKHYEASFNYYDPNRDPVAFFNALIGNVSVFFTSDQIKQLMDCAVKASDAPEDRIRVLLVETMKEMQKMNFGANKESIQNQDRTKAFEQRFFSGLSSLADGVIWFTILDYYGEYRIALYYDNLHNRPHGEDL